MRTQNFGIEIEMTGLTRAAAARIIAGHFGTQATHVGGGYDSYTVRDDRNRIWKVVSDASIRCRNGNNRSASRDYSVEFVSPICQYEDIETVQELVRKLRNGGARVNDSCGIHVHVDASSHTPQTLRNIVNIMASKEDLLYKTLNVQIGREHYCRKADTRFLDELNHKRPRTMDEVERMWYNGRGGRYIHYDDSRYHALNLHSVFSKGTIEFRMFNSTLHAGEVKSYIQLCLAISHQALVQRGASRIKTQPENEKYTFRTWLLRLGLIGDEFKTARQHLLKNLEGNIAWRDPAQAEAQKARLAAKRLAEQQETEAEPTEQPTDQPDEQDQDAPALTMQMYGDERMSKRLYVAYGSNLNIRQMKYRCPGAKLYGTGTIEDYELQFKGQPHSAFATIAPKEGSSVPVAVWEISAKNEQALDRYEGYPSHYFKKDVPVRMDGGEVTAMVYIMNQRMHFGLPSSYYYETVYEGYNDCGLDTDVLESALRESAVQFYGSHRQHQPQQTLFDVFDSGDDEGITDSDLDDGEPDMDESDPFYFSEGMHL